MEIVEFSFTLALGRRGLWDDGAGKITGCTGSDNALRFGKGRR
jgi:hypothetical protein